MQEQMIRARAKLEAMSLDSRIAAVAADVASKRDEYRKIECFDLASLLGIDDARELQGDWRYVWYIPRISSEEICERWDWEFLLELLEPHVTEERLETLAEKFGTSGQIDTEDGRVRNALLTEKERESLEHAFMEDAKKAFDPKCIAYLTIDSSSNTKLTFQAYVEDDGGCVDLLTPYDERDGKFPDLTDALIIEDRR